MRAIESIRSSVKFVATLFRIAFVLFWNTLPKVFSTDKEAESCNSSVPRPECPLQSWSLIKRMGEGSDGVVYSAIDRNGYLLAVKKITRNRRRQAHEVESEFLRVYPHAKIVQFYSITEDEEGPCIFTELMPLGSLSSLLMDYGKGLTERQAACFIRQVLQAVAHLHHNRIIHRDIKGANILVGPGGVAKLVDFGSAIKMESDYVVGAVGTYYWRAPEVRRGEHYGVGADIWSVGCTTLELLWGWHPYAIMTQAAAVEYIRSGKKPPLPPDLSTDAKDFIQQCLADREVDRPTALQLLEHPFICFQPH